MSLQGCESSLENTKVYNPCVASSTVGTLELTSGQLTLLGADHLKARLHNDWAFGTVGSYGFWTMQIGNGSAGNGRQLLAHGLKVTTRPSSTAAPAGTPVRFGVMVVPSTTAQVVLLILLNYFLTVFCLVPVSI